MILCHTLSGQLIMASDIELLSNYSMQEEHPEHKPEWVFKDTKSLVVKYNPISLFLGSSLYMYQATISKQLSAKCLYDVSCSNYSKHVIHELGIIKGLSLSADRITRCNRLAAEDIHTHQINKITHKVIDPFLEYEKK